MLHLFFPRTGNDVRVEDNENPINTMKCIIKSYRHPTRSFLLVEMGNTLGREAKSICCLLELAIEAVDLGWYVVVASSSGSGWQVETHTSLENKTIKELSAELKCSIAKCGSHNFFKEEMKECMKALQIGETWLNAIFELTAGNPLLVSMFRNCRDEEEFADS